MKKKVVVISSSLRKNSNSDTLAQAFAKGAQEAGHQVEIISLKNKKIEFCVGCLSCQKTGRCYMKDDAIEIEKKVVKADVVALATPVYYFGMAGQLKTLLDRLNPMYPKNYRFRDIYAFITAAENEKTTPSKTLTGIKGWIDCFEKARLAGKIFCGDLHDGKDIEGKPQLKKAYQMGLKI